LGPVSYKTTEEDPFLGREIHRQRSFSEHTMEVIDEEVARILHESSQAAQKILHDHRDNLERLARRLLETEELTEKEIRELIGPSAHEQVEDDKPAQDQAPVARDS
jgi:cell division protease FtsH